MYVYCMYIVYIIGAIYVLWTLRAASDRLEKKIIKTCNALVTSRLRPQMVMNHST